MPLKSSLLFNKSKHSEEWHQAIDAIAGVLHPSDPKFPHALLRQATDVYLKKKGKISQTDADIRLAILIDAHEATDIAVAAAAHAITAGSLRATLHVDLNVAHGNYWGLMTWLQCVIAANRANPASFTDLDATWAHYLLPFATHGAAAAGKILIGVSRALMECATPSMNMVPEFLSLTSRALADYSAHLEGLRLRNNWVAAHGASYWMIELGRVSPATTPPGFLLPEHIFDTQFPIWRAWANWRPNLRRITALSSMDNNSAAEIPALLALEGPDFINGNGVTLREGLVEQYKLGRSWVKFGSMLIEVPGRTKDGLRDILESAASTLETIWTTAPKDRPEVFKLFVELTINRPITQEALNLIQAVLYMQGGIDSDNLEIILRIYTEHDDLGGYHIEGLQRIIQLLDQDRTDGLRRILLTPKLLKDITRCLQDCQCAVRTLIERRQPWTEFALELHAFCTVLKNSKTVSVVEERLLSEMCLLLPPEREMSMACKIYTAAREFEPEQFHDAEATAKSSEGAITTQRVIAPSFLTGQSEQPKYSLEEIIEQYCLHRLLAQEAAGFNSQRIFDTILRVWESTYGSKLGEYQRQLAILVTKITSNNVDLGMKCLNGIVPTSEELSLGLPLKSVVLILQRIEKDPDDSNVRFIRLLARCPDAWSPQGLSCWRDLAYSLLAEGTHLNVFRDRNMINYTLKTMKAAEWLSFLTEVEMLFASDSTIHSDEESLPPILQSDLQKWKRALAPYTTALTQLELALGQGNEAIRCILSGDCGRGRNTIALLQSLEAVKSKPVAPFLYQIVGLLSTKSSKTWGILDCISLLTDASSETVEICKKIWDAKNGFLDIPGLPVSASKSSSQETIRVGYIAVLPSAKPSSEVSLPLQPTASRYDVPSSVVEVMVAGWLLDEEADESIKNAVHSIARLLDVVQVGFDVSKEQLTEAATFWQKIEDELVEEAQRMESLRRALKTSDPKETTLLLQHFNIPDTNELDDEMMRLSAEVLNAVEKVSANEVEMSFSLAALTQLQRTAMGVPDIANALLLRLQRDDSTDSSPSFCLHYNSHLQFETMSHSPYSCSAGSEHPTRQICSSGQTVLTWQLSRVIYSRLRRGDTAIETIYRSTLIWLRDIAQFCVSCSTSHKATTSQLRRSTPCDLLSCAQLWYNLPLHVRIPEIRTDTFAVDVALASVYAAAMTGKAELLPSCPIRGSELIKSILDSLPQMAVMRDAVNLSAVLTSYHASAEKLLSWAVVHHRGFLATATGLLKIPNLPVGTHQFVLANASPSAEKAFVSKIQWTKRETTALFHGTSLDRLPAILAQGLRVCSGTPLQRTGAAHGKGIYLADDPATSFYYSPTSLSWKNSGLTNMKLLLGCEVVGAGNRVSGTIHVVSDVESVMVRYILLFTREARVPIRGHIEPAMASGMKALRSGAV